MELIVKDSLGLGIKKTITGEQIYTEEENENFTRQLLTPEEKEIIKKEEIISIKDVRNIIRENTLNDTYDKIEPDLLVAIDSRINYNIYVVHDNIYTYEELCISFPFQEFNILPKSIFVRQIIVIFNDETIEVFNEGDPIISAHDMIKIATDKIKSQDEIKQYKNIIKSKVFIGGEKWKDFLQLRGFFRGMVQVNNLQIENGQTPVFLKPFTNAISNQLMLTDCTNEENKVNGTNEEYKINEENCTNESTHESKKQVEQQFVQIEQQFEQRFVQIEQQFVQIENRLTNIENKLTNIENKLS